MGNSNLNLEKTIELALSNIDPLTPLKSKYTYTLTKNLKFNENENFYVDLYEDRVRKLRTELFYSSKDFQVFFATGQLGVGKTTALSFLADQKVISKYEPILVTFAEVEQAFDDADEFDVSIILLKIAYTLIDLPKIKDTPEERELKRLFQRELERNKALKEGTLEIVKREMKELKGEITLKAFFSKVLANRYVRKEVIEKLIPHLEDLLSLTNEIIAKYEELVLNNKKRVLLILDDTEKITHQKLMDKLFIDQAQYWKQIAAHKIIMYPIILPIINSKFAGSLVSTNINFNLPVKNSIFEHNIVEKNRENFKKLIKKRFENIPNIEITEDALELAIDKSSGIIRIFLKIIRQALLNYAQKILYFDLDTSKVIIDLPEIEQAIEEEQSNLSSFLIGKRTALLKKVKETKSLDFAVKDTDLQEVIDMTYGNLIIIYHNSQKYVYVNPLIEKLL